MKSIVSKIGKYLDPVYLKNRIPYVVASNPPIDDSRHQEDILKEQLHLSRFSIESLEEHVSIRDEHMKGLYVHRKFFSEEELSSIRTFVDEIVDEDSDVDWYEYHPGRRMIPLQPFPNVDPILAEGVLRTLESQNMRHPNTWPSLSNWIRKTESDGAKALVRLQQFLERGELAPEANQERCLFMQIQHLERGSQVGGHIDDLRKGGRVISTAVIDGANDIRVGDRIFRVEPGDVYALASHARYDVDHEVYSSVSDRLSATLRFGLIEMEEPPSS